MSLEKGFKPSYQKRPLTLRDNNTDTRIWELIQVCTQLGGIMAAPYIVYNYTVGATNGPVAGGTTFILPINPVIAYQNPVYKNNTLLVKGTDYSINVATGVFTLLASTFTINDIYTLV